MHGDLVVVTREVTAGIGAGWRGPTIVILLVILITSSATILPAQVSSASFHATLSRVDESNWLRILDRNAASGGRLSSLGILQRFHPYIDTEYQLDRMAAAFTLTEDYAWYRLDRNGFRWTGGSITKRDLMVDGQFKATVPIGETWSFGVWFDQQANPTTDRNLVRVGGAKRWGSGVHVSARASLSPMKPDSDLEFDIGWRSEPVQNPRHQARLSLAVLDWSTNLIYGGLDAAAQSEVDSTLAYDRQPFALHGSVSSRVSRTIRTEVYGAVMTPSAIVQYEGFDRNQGLRQEEQYGYAGGLVEWSSGRRLRIGGFATYIRALTERTALSAAADVEEYRLREVTVDVGAFGLLGLGGSWLMQAVAWRNWRPEERVFRQSTTPDVDYLDQAWMGRLLVQRTAAEGLLADFGLLWDLRAVVRGDGDVPSAQSLNWDNYRLTAALGWRFNRHVMFLLGTGVDLDGDHSGTNRFDGLRGRFAVVW